jgi:hypothetical protein
MMPLEPVAGATVCLRPRSSNVFRICPSSAAVVDQGIFGARPVLLVESAVDKGA